MPAARRTMPRKSHQDINDLEGRRVRAHRFENGIARLNQERSEMAAMRASGAPRSTDYGPS